MIKLLNKYNKLLSTQAINNVKITNYQQIFKKNYYFFFSIVVDIDETFSIIVNLYQKKKEEIGNNVKKLFYAADVN